MTEPRNPSRPDDTADQQGTDEQRKLDDVIDAVNARHTRHGFLSDKFSTL